MALTVELNSEHATVGYPEIVTTVRSGKRGRPRKVLNPAYLAEAMSNRRRISTQTLAKTLKVHRHTLRKQLTHHGITRKFDLISDANLDIILRTYKMQKPKSGQRYVMGYLQSCGLRIQRYRIAASLARVDGLGRALRRREAIQRRKYSVARPNALWHCDGHHKLINWGIVLHGFVDGYDRTVRTQSQ